MTELRQTLFLVGMPGVGKSYWGLKLSEAFGVRFIDLDEMVQTHVGKTIPEIFAMGGEMSFREYERICLHEMVASGGHGTIVACGGGTPCFYDNMNLMLRAGVVIYLEADVSQLLINLSGEGESRPLISEGNLNEEALGVLLDKRIDVYRKAHHILHVKDISISTFEKIIRDV